MTYPELKSIDKPKTKLTIISEAVMGYGKDKNYKVEVCTILFASKGQDEDKKEIVATFRKEDLKKLFERDFASEEPKEE